MPQKKPPVPTRSTFQKDTDNAREFKGGKAGASVSSSTPGGRPTKQQPSQKGPSNKGRK